MRNFPKYINNKLDVENLLVDSPVETKAYLQSLIDTKDNWFPTGALATAIGVTDATHKVHENKGLDDVITYTQYELREDPNGTIFRLGYASVAEAIALLK